MRPRSIVLAALSLGSGAAAVGAALEGCALPSFTLEIKPDAGPDAMPEAGMPGYIAATYPDPPGGMDDGNSIGTLVFALHSIDLGDTGTTPGYDLDHAYTCFHDAGPTCVGKSTQSSTYCDGMDGIDNQAAKLFQLIEVPAGSAVFGSGVFSTQADMGKWSLLIRVDGYNGMPDDPDVKVAVYPSPGPVMPPKWMGADSWRVTAGSVLDGGVDTPRFTSNGAYVAQGTLVATLPTSEIAIAGGGQDTITVRFSAAVLTGKLVSLGAQWHIQSGVIAGRWALTDVFKAVSSYRDNMGKPLCTDQGLTYTLAKNAICDDADILVDGTQPKSAPCDALSIAVGFTADAAHLGPVSDAGIDSPGCPAATDPANDSCN